MCKTVCIGLVNYNMNNTWVALFLVAEDGSEYVCVRQHKHYSLGVQLNELIDLWNPWPNCFLLPRVEEAMENN